MTGLSIEELQRRALLASKSAKLEAHLNGVPYTVSIDGRIIKVYPDGNKTEVIRVDGKREEIPYVEA